MSVHPSELELDRAILGAAVSPDVAAHLRSCPRCSAAIATRRTSGDVPAWVAEIRVRPAAAPRRWLLLALPAAAAVAVALVVLPPRPIPTGVEELRPKGIPVITLYVKRGDRVSSWDGRSAVRQGDRLRVGVRGAGYAQLSVASIPPSGAPLLLYRGPVEPAGETLVPLSFRVDARGPSELLSVILSSEPVETSAHLGATTQLGPDGAWAVRLYLPKETEP